MLTGESTDHTFDQGTSNMLLLLGIAGAGVALPPI